MRISHRSMLAVGVVLLLSALVFAAKWYENDRAAPGRSAATVELNVTNGGDRGPGTLREALFVAAAAEGKASISIKVPKISIATALPPLVNTRGISISAQEPGAEIDAQGLPGGAVFDIAGANTSIEGIVIRNCRAAGVLLRAAKFRLEGVTIEACDVGVDVAENASDLLIERNRFQGNRLGLRFAASSRNAAVVKNEFSGNKDAGIWAVRSAPDLRGAAINVRENRFNKEQIGVLAANVSMLLERNDLIDSRKAAVQLMGAGAVVRGNRISGGASMGIVAENARAAIIDNNELDHLAAYGVMSKSSSNTLVRGNRLHNCGYGLAFVLGDADNPSTAVDNTIMEPKYNGIDVIGDSPILRRNRVLRPRVMALHVEDFVTPEGKRVRAKPFLDNNSFGTSAATVASGPVPQPPNAGTAR